MRNALEPDAVATPMNSTNLTPCDGPKPPPIGGSTVPVRPALAVQSRFRFSPQYLALFILLCLPVLCVIGVTGYFRLGSETKAQVLELRPRASGAPGPAAASPLSCLPGARGQAEARTVMIPITAWARFPASGRCFPPGAAGASRRSGPGPETFPAPKTY